MIKLTATAPIYSISPVIDIPSKSGGAPFQKRELWLDDSWTGQDGQSHTSVVAIEATGQKMDLLNMYAPGMRVTVEVVVSGREVNGRVYNTLRLLNISQSVPQTFAATAAPTAPTQPAYAPQPAYQPQTAPTYPQQPSYPHQPAYPQPAPQPAYPQPAYTAAAPTQNEQMPF